MTYDYKRLCIQLLSYLYQCDWPDGERFYALAERARIALEPPQPVPVSERLPEPSTKVLAHYFNALGKGRTICAIWVPAKSRSDEGDLDAYDFLEYDEDDDKCYWPEGWYEAIENWEELGWVKVYEGEIAYWQPLPQWPANALPTPRPPMADLSPAAHWSSSMTSPHIFQWEGTDNPNDPSGVATFKCNGKKVSVIFYDFVTASKFSGLIDAAYECGKHDAINKAKLAIPKLLDEQRYD